MTSEAEKAPNLRGPEPLTRQDYWLMAILVAISLLIYARTVRFDFVPFDDQLYVYSNAFVIRGLSPETLRWSMTAAPNGNWDPLTTVVDLTISSLFGIQPGPYHAVNTVLQAANVALLFLFFRRATGLRWPAFFTALLWGVHPLRVESVAWISELKDVLCGVFWLGCMLAYLRYSHRRTVLRFLLVAVVLSLSLLSKPMAVTLPFALLLLDVWPISQQIDRDQPRLRWWSFRLLEKIPLLAISLADILAQKNRMSLTGSNLPFGLRLQNAVVSTAWYVRDLFFPRHLAVFYPHPYFEGKGIASSAVWLSIGILLAISLIVILCGRRYRFIPVGWFWFLGTLVPVLGLVQAGEQARADRFTYFPSIGITFAVVWWIWESTTDRLQIRRFAIAAACTAAVVLAGVSVMDVSPWKNSDTLFDNLHALQPDNFFALLMLGERSSNQGRPREAMEFNRQAVELSPLSFNTHASYGHLLWKSGQLGPARDQFATAVRLNPDISQNWDGLGNVYASEGDLCSEHHDPAESTFRQRAIDDFQKAIDTDASNFAARQHLAEQLARLPGRLNEAIGIWEQTLHMSPDDADAHGHLADMFARNGDTENAVAHYAAALRAGSRNPKWETGLAWLVGTDPVATSAQVQWVVTVAKDACDQTAGHDAAALDAYAACLARLGRFDDAVAAGQTALELVKAGKDPAQTAAIQSRLALYKNGQPFTIKTVTKTENGTAR